MLSSDVIIIGAGPAGLFAGLELIGHKKVILIDAGRSLVKKICPLESRKKCLRCKPVCNILGGFGGAQFFMGTKLSTYPAGKGLLYFVNDKKQLDDLYLYVDEILEKNGKCKRIEPSPRIIENLYREFGEVGLELKYYNAQKVSKKEMNEIATNFYQHLVSGNVNIRFQELVKDIQAEGNGFYVRTNRCKYYAGIIILCLGRVGSRHLIRLSDNLGIQYEKPGATEIELGVRVETPYNIFDKVNNIHNDLKLKSVLKNGNGEMRSFCFDYRGYLTKCFYNLEGDNEMSSIDGYINGTELNGGRMSDLSNLGIHHRFKVESDMQDIYEMVSCISSKKNPLVQSMRGFLENKDNYDFDIELSLPDAERDNINNYLPKNSAEFIKDFILKIDMVLKGFAHPGNAVYAPSFEMGAVKMNLTPYFESTVKNIYIAGDSTGHFRGSMQAMISGVLIANRILER